jgi:hypothetical protein
MWGGEMVVEPWLPSQPGAHFGVLVGAVVVDDQVHLEFGRDLLVNPPQETQNPLLPVPGLAFGDHRTCGHIQGSKQGGGSVFPGLPLQPFLTIPRSCIFWNPNCYLITGNCGMQAMLE